MNNKLLSKIVDFLFEAGTAKNIKRSHKQVLPQADDTIASKILKRNPLQWVYNFAQIPAEDEK